MQGKKPLNIAIGRRIQQSREQAGLTQEELACLLYTSDAADE